MQLQGLLAGLSGLENPFKTTVPFLNGFVRGLESHLKTTSYPSYPYISLYVPLTKGLQRRNPLNKALKKDRNLFKHRNPLDSP